MRSRTMALPSSSLKDIGVTMATIVIIHNGFGMALGFAMSKLCHLDSRASRTVAIEVGMQNSGMAVSLAVMYFNPAAAIPGAIFSVWHNVAGSIFANYFAKKDAPSLESIKVN